VQNAFPNPIVVVVVAVVWLSLLFFTLTSRELEVKAFGGNLECKLISQIQKDKNIHKCELSENSGLHTFIHT
jgi:hypothetical protein